jgi:D-threo-aldose 1-dehydrogenase
VNPSAPLPSRPRLGIGCASLGTPAPALDDAAAEDVMAAAWARGIRFFDVAPLYGGGVAEERLGRALAGRPRDDYTLCTKTGVTRAYATTAMPPGATRRRQFDRWDFSAAATRASVETSLRRLRTDRLDVVHLHDAEDHLDASLEAYAELARLRDAGVVVAIGIGSNVPAAVRALLDRAVFTTFLLAGAYTLLDQSGAALLDEAHARGIRVVIGGVFNSGVLAAWPNPSPTFAYAPADAAILQRTARIAAICADHGVSLGAAALQFAASHPAVDTLLIGPRTVAELDQNLAAYAEPVPGALWKALADVGVTPGPRARRAPAAAHS